MRRALPFLLLLACHNQKAAPETAKPPTMKEKCCAQCAAASRRDPAGMDISGKTCTSYPVEWNSGPGVDDECRGWFVAQPQPTLVGECWKAATP